MTKRHAKRKGLKFRVGQIVVGTHSRDYISRIMAVYRIGDHFRYEDSTGNEWGDSDLRAQTARERGGK